MVIGDPIGDIMMVVVGISVSGYSAMVTLVCW